MIERCTNPRHVGYKYYGARGITVCQQWQSSFTTFMQDMGPKPTPRHTLDRKDTDGNYEPKNCKWATYAEQRANQRPYDESARVYKSWETGKRSRVSHACDDLAAQRFGKLLVVSFAGKNNEKRTCWLCQCDCGTQKVIRGKSLRNGSTQSCGCARTDKIKEIAKGRTSEEQRARAIKGWQKRRMQTS